MNKIYLIILLPLLLCACGQNKSNIKYLDKAQRVTTQEDSTLRDQFRKVYGQFDFKQDKVSNYQTDLKVFYRNNYKVTISNSYYIDSLPSSKVNLTIEGEHSKYVDTLDFKSAVFVTSINADVDIHNGRAFISWVSANFEQGVPAVIWLKTVNLKNQQVEFFNKLYSQRWGIERIALAYNPFNKAVHIVYNDFSQPNSKYLYFGSVDGNSLKEAKFAPKSILNQDNSEKRYPQFIRTPTSVFLYNTTGDTWGILAHTGKQGVGISEIGKDNKPVNYMVLADSNTVNNEILIANGTVFYQHVVGNNNGEFEIKEVVLNGKSSTEK